MFLFTTPGPSTPAPPQSAAPVIDAIREGAAASGTSFDYLLQTAKRESSLDPAAKAPTSSATGLFQFIEQTWLGLIKRDGERLGLADEARAVTARSDGTYAVADPEARQALLDLRKDPQLSAMMAGALTQQNRESLVASTGREPAPGELYMAHVLGARGASDLIAAASADPSKPAAQIFPEAARANRSIFYDKAGRARGAGEVYSLLGSAQGGSAPAPQPPASSAQPPESLRPPGIQGLFQTGSRPGPLSDAVARIWRSNTMGASGNRDSGVKVASFFPRSTPLPAEAADDLASSAPAADEPPTSVAPAPAATGVEQRLWDGPLPPPRPSFAPPGQASSRALNLKIYARAARP